MLNNLAQWDVSRPPTTAQSPFDQETDKRQQISLMARLRSENFNVDWKQYSADGQLILICSEHILSYHIRLEEEVRPPHSWHSGDCSCYICGSIMAAWLWRRIVNSCNLGWHICGSDSWKAQNSPFPLIAFTLRGILSQVTPPSLMQNLRKTFKESMSQRCKDIILT